jgi:hypothetical protein
MAGISDTISEGANNEAIVNIADGSGATTRRAEVVPRIDGKDALAVDAVVNVEQIPGRDPLPDTFFTIVNTGIAGSTLRIDIAATANDPSSPDRDLPAYTKTFTVVAGEVGDEIKLRDRIVSELNADTTFKNTALLEANSVGGDLRAIIHISSTEFSLSTEFAERGGAGDFDVVTAGATVNIGFDNLISRNKPASLARDPNNPHRLGVLDISGTVRIRGSNATNLYFADAELSGSNELAVDGTTPKVFSINANASAADEDIILEQLKLHGIDTNIKVQGSNFMGLNSALTNGIKIEVFTGTDNFLLPTLFSTRDLLARFGTSSSDNKIINQSGGDFIESVFSLVDKNVIIELEAGTTDRIEITIQDDISSVTSLVFTAEGFEE